MFNIINILADQVDVSSSGRAARVSRYIHPLFKVDRCTVDATIVTTCVIHVDEGGSRLDYLGPYTIYYLNSRTYKTHPFPLSSSILISELRHVVLDCLDTFFVQLVI